MGEKVREPNGAVLTSKGPSMLNGIFSHMVDLPGTLREGVYQKGGGRRGGRDQREGLQN